MTSFFTTLKILLNHQDDGPSQANGMWKPIKRERLWRDWFQLDWLLAKKSQAQRLLALWWHGNRGKGGPEQPLRFYVPTSSTGPLSVSQSGSQPANRPAENSHTWAELEDMPFHLLWLEGGDHYYAIFFQCLIQMIKKLKRVSNYFYLIYGQQIQSHFYILLFAELLQSCDL